MPKYKLKDPETEMTVIFEGDSPPTQEEQQELFSRFITQGTPTTGGAKTFYESTDIAPSIPQPQDTGFVEGLLQQVLPTGGSVAGALYGAKLGRPLGLPGVIVGGGLGAFLGGSTGQGATDAINVAVDNPNAPKSLESGFNKAVRRGRDEMLYDVAGNAAFRGIGAAYRVLEPTAGAIGARVADLFSTKASVAAKTIDKGLKKFGGKLPLSKLTGSDAFMKADSYVKGSLVGSGRIKKLEILNSKALVKMEGHLRKNVAKRATKDLSDQELGHLFLDTVNGGRTAHRAIVSKMYSRLDEMVPSKHITRDGVIVEVNPVNLIPMKASIIPNKQRLERIQYVDETTETKSLLESIANQYDTLSFETAQLLRSGLLNKQRYLEKKIGTSDVLNEMNGIVGEITKAMDKAAGNVGGGTLDQYLRMKSYASKGYDIFDAKLLADILSSDKVVLERIADTIFQSGNVSKIRRARVAIRASARYLEGTSYDEVWGQMQKSYLNGILNKAAKAGGIPLEAVVDDMGSEMLETVGERLLREFTDPKKSSTLEMVFDKKMRQEILDFAKTAELVQRS